MMCVVKKQLFLKAFTFIYSVEKGLDQELVSDLTMFSINIIGSAISVNVMCVMSHDM